MSYELEPLGWDAAFADAFEPHAVDGLVPGRVAVQHRGAYDVYTELGELRVDMAGRLSHEATGAGDLPAVGDWVAVAARPGENAGTIQAVLPRRTKFSRKVAWSETEEQVLCANIDVVFIVMSLNEDYNVRRLERYLTLAWESGAQPVVLLTKTDLCDDVPRYVLEAEAVAFGVTIHAISSLTGDGLDLVRGHLTPGKTVALLGSSGVGKSTLVNTLAGEELLATRELREDGQGRHTTSHRELVVLPSGGLVVDTPGMRELQLWEASEGLSETFDDVEEVAASCRFNDCSHLSEPGCAVLAALEDGTLDRGRWESYGKLQRELAHLERRLDKRLQAEERKKWRAAGAEAKANLKMKGHL